VNQTIGASVAAKKKNFIFQVANLISNNQLYIGMYLPQDTQATSAALVKFSRVNANEEGVFAYGKKYLNNEKAIPLHPGAFPLTGEVKTLPSHPIRDHGALPVVMQDALPDGWGKLVISSQLGGRTPSDIELLLQTNSDRVGAMVFSESSAMAPDSFPQTHDLIKLSEAIDRIQYGMDLTDDLRRLLLLGGSLGGARPKASFVHNNALWLAKFPMIGDVVDMQIMEYSTLKLAEKCGIQVPSMILVPAGKHGFALLSKRFDRYGKLDALSRIHYLSLSGLANVPYESNACSYVEFATLLHRLGSNSVPDMHELFRRMVFNIVVDNSDDHIKNHGVLYSGNGRYKLSPAFDVVPQFQNLGYTSLSIDGKTQNAHLDIARQVAPHFGLPQQVADDIIYKILETVHTDWEDIFKTNHADKTMLDLMRACLKRQYSNIGAFSRFQSSIEGFS
jgi:serine/threonine-protein kinase HipA